jgi:hypothetical protein
MSCQTCKSDKIARVGGKTSDRCTVDGPGGLTGEPDYVPDGIGIGGGDYIQFSYCLNCGTIQGDWPKQAPVAEDGEGEW